MSLFYEIGSEQTDLSAVDMKNGIFDALRSIGQRNRVLAIPPDLTRIHSRAGDLTRNAYEFYKERLAAILPAVGTHASVTSSHVGKMFGDIPFNLFHAHNWRTDTVTLGRCPLNMCTCSRKVSSTTPGRCKSTGCWSKAIST
jgi:hypothetical protein